MVVTARAPLRVSFAGGGTDVPPFPETEGGVVLSATIDQFVHGTLWPRADGRIDVDSDLALAAVKRIGRVGTGFRLALRSGVPPGSGLGSSSAASVVLVGLLREHFQLPLSEYETAALAHQVERADLGISGGLQDHYAATFGGLNFIEFGDRVVVRPLPVRDSVINELEAGLLLCFTGVTRDSADIIVDQTARLRGRRGRTLEGLRAQKKLAFAMRDALLRGDLDSFGALLDEAWTQKKKLSPLIATPHIDQVYDLAIRNGALGGKVTGAGGGGHLLFYCGAQRKQRVRDALTGFGATVTEPRFERAGLTTWRA